MGTAEEMASMIPNGASRAYIRYIPNDMLNYSNACLDLCDLVTDLSHTYSVNVLGYSMGGRLATSILSKISMYVNQVILISSGLPLSDPKSRYLKQRFDATAIQKAHQLSSINFCKWWYSLPIYSTLHHHKIQPELIKKRSNSFNKDTFSTLIERLSVLNMPQVTVSNSLTQFHFAYVYGEQDHKYEQIARNIQLIFPNIKLFPIKNASHLCWVESPLDNHLDIFQT